LLEGVLQNKRNYIINELYNYGIETRPVVTGNFLKNPVRNFMNYEISGVLKNVENLDRRGFYVGNSHFNLEKQLSKLAEIIYKLYKNIN
jgi:CDP-6-deoxy-D-xylo-4-hexulose-3-dehydrase